MIKLSDLKSGISNPDTLTSLYLNDNVLDTIDGRELLITGGDRVRINTDKGLIIQDGYETIPGGVLTAINGTGEARWQVLPANLQAAYEATNTITTSSTFGDLKFTGSEALIISTSSGIRYEIGDLVDGYVLTSDAYGNGSWQESISDLQGAYETSNILITDPLNGDLEFTGSEKVIINTASGLDLDTVVNVSADAYFSANIQYQNGSPSAGQFLSSTDSNGTAAWATLPAASSSAVGTVSREFDSGESTSTTPTWNGSTPSSLDYNLFRCIRIGNKVDVWFKAKYASNSGASEGVTFPLPASCPNPTLWSTNSANEIITHGEGRLFESDNGLDITNQDQTSEVSLHHASGTFSVSISTFKRVVNLYGSHSQQPLNPIGFVAHISYFTDV